MHDQWLIIQTGANHSEWKGVEIMEAPTDTGQLIT